MNKSASIILVIILIIIDKTNLINYFSPNYIPKFFLFAPCSILWPVEAYLETRKILVDPLNLRFNHEIIHLGRSERTTRPIVSSLSIIKDCVWFVKAKERFFRYLFSGKKSSLSIITS